MGEIPAITLMRESIVSKVSVDFIDALNQWLNGNDAPLFKKFPGEYYLLVLSDYQTFRATIEKSIAIRREAAEKRVEYMKRWQVESSFLIDRSIGFNRPFDIIARYNDLLTVELAMIEEGILDHDKHFIANRHKGNKRCLAGVYKLLIRNGYFKKCGPGKNNKNKRISRFDIYRFLNQRYGIKQFQELSRPGNIEEMAIRRFPFLIGN